MERSIVIDLKTLELIKNNQYSEGTTFREEMRSLIRDFYEGFDLDKQDPKCKESYIRNFLSLHEAFIINYEMNVYNPHARTTDPLSDEITFCKFLDTLAAYLTKYYDEDGQTVTDFRKEKYKNDRHKRTRSFQNISKIPLD